MQHDGRDMSSDIKHSRIDATVYNDRVEEIHLISDIRANVRPTPQTRVWQIEKSLGRGGFAAVRLEKRRDSEEARAVKWIEKGTASLSTNDCEKELTALLAFNMPKYKLAGYFVDFYGWFEDSSSIFFAMEYFQLGDLEKNVVAHSGKLPECEAQDIAQQILSGLEIMHAESFAHRDLKPQNVLVAHGPPKWWIKLADFGLSKKLTDNTAYMTRAGTRAYMAPEMLGIPCAGYDVSDKDLNTSHYTNAVDIWAVGCIVYRLVTGGIPFPCDTIFGPLMHYCQDKASFPLDPLFDCGIKSEGSKFVRQLLVANPKERPSASLAKRHKWIISGPNTAQPSDAKTNQLTEPTVSTIAFNTVSHAGLKSYLGDSTSLSESSYTQSSIQTSSSTEADLTTVTPQSVTLRNPVRQPHFETSANELQANIERELQILRSRKFETSINQLQASIEKELQITQARKYKQDIMSRDGGTAPKASKSNPSGYNHNERAQPLPSSANDSTLDMFRRLKSPSQTVSRATSSALESSKNVGSSNKPVLSPQPSARESTLEMFRRLRSPSQEVPHWMVSHKDKAKFDVIYDDLDKTNRGYISGDIAVPFFAESKLPEEVLGQIWELADIDCSGVLSRDEFAVAMYLIQQQRALHLEERGKLPSSLPAKLIPPSMRMQARPPPPTTPASDSLVPTLRKSAAEDLFGLDTQAPSTAARAQSSSREGHNQTRGHSVALPVCRVKARFPFTAVQRDELSFQEGDIIAIKEMVDKSWWKGKLESSEGLFPVNCVEILPVPTTAELCRNNITHVEALFDCRSSQPQELSFRKGDIICLIQRKYIQQWEWWLGELRGKQGIFPLIYVKLYKENQSKYARRHYTSR